MMKIIAVMVLLLAFAVPIWAQDVTPEATPEATPLPAQIDYPPLDATFCADGLQFKYPSSWYLFQPKSTNPNAQKLISVLVMTDKDGISVYRNHGLAISIDVYKATELLELFRSQSADEGGAYMVLSGILKYFSDTLAGSNLEEFITPDGDHKFFLLRLHEMTDDITYTLLDSGVMIRFDYSLSAPFENPELWDSTASAIFDTITYDPGTLCPSTEQ
ncbi:MAG TPA: hypothetical protein VHD90_22175 [Phototrophicaceae bacterium]|nr:hypothetical protein [Phototrophicaceae bacterium]